MQPTFFLPVTLRSCAQHVSRPLCELAWDLSSCLGFLQIFFPCPKFQQDIKLSLHLSAHLQHILKAGWKLSQRANLAGFPALTVPLPFWKHKIHSWSKSLFPLGSWIQTLAHLCRPVIKSGVQVTSATGSGDGQKDTWKKWHLFLGWRWCFSERKVLAATQ